MPMSKVAPDRDSLTTRIVEALRQSGRPIDELTYRDLIPVSELHNRGKQATVDLARLAEIQPEQHILDVGCGIGGPARTLAAEFGCRVTGIDISDEFCSAAQSLNELVGLSERISIRRADALALPFEDESFDIVWTQHASMNIADKQVLFTEMHRVLRPGGKLALHDVMAGPVQPVHFPVPWAPDPSISFLAEPEESRALILATGFEELSWQDQTQLTEDWWQNVRERASGKPLSPLNPSLVIGSQFPEMAHNMYLSIRERRIAIVQAVHRKKPAQ